jgi:putative addiction module CopG family antidote
MTMNVNLTPQLEHMAPRKVASGHYTSASEVVRDDTISPAEDAEENKSLFNWITAPAPNPDPGLE